MDISATYVHDQSMGLQVLMSVGYAHTIKL